ncbi:MAG: hypothetical protein V2I40_15575 [Desulfobacteraceae bacterium]|jgi:hypothetical protein|nr:hypothetical protein [Desulfobacteraceae bacterium]
MPTISCFLSTTDHPMDENHALWHRLLPGNRLFTAQKPNAVDTAAVTYGRYFSALVEFCAAGNWDRIASAASRQLEQPVVEEDLDHVAIFLEKHGAFYHPARLQVTVKDRTLSFVINAAASSRGRKALAREVRALEHLNAQRPFGWFPRVYSYASDRLPMFLGDWFDGFHEFHLTRRSGIDDPAIVVWDGAAAPCLLSDTQAAGLYRNAAMILTACYDPITSSQIFPWHHAAGDFVVRVEAEGVRVRLITVRDYAPMPGCAAEARDERSLLDALMVFFIHLTLRMRLDRIDGVKEVAWASDRCLSPTVDGFFKGLDLTARMNGLPETFPETFRQFYSHHDAKAQLANACWVAETFFDPRSDERRLVDRHRTRHLNGLRRRLAV